MKKQQMEGKIKELWVTGLQSYDWNALSMTHLALIMRLISAIESSGDSGEMEMNLANHPPSLTVNFPNR